MILRFDKKGNFVSWMDRIPKRNKITLDGSRVIRTHDIRRVLEGERKTAGGYQWVEVKAQDLTKKNNNVI